MLGAPPQPRTHQRVAPLPLPRPRISSTRVQASRAEAVPATSPWSARKPARGSPGEQQGRDGLAPRVAAPLRRGSQRPDGDEARQQQRRRGVQPDREAETERGHRGMAGSPQRAQRRPQIREDADEQRRIHLDPPGEDPREAAREQQEHHGRGGPSRRELASDAQEQPGRRATAGAGERAHRLDAGEAQRGREPDDRPQQERGAHFRKHEVGPVVRHGDQHRRVSAEVPLAQEPEDERHDHARHRLGRPARGPPARRGCEARGDPVPDRPRAQREGRRAEQPRRPLG